MKVIPLCLLVLLCGCADIAPPPEIPEGSTPVYYITDWNENDQADAVLSARYVSAGQDDPVAFCLSQLFLTPPEEEGLLSPFPNGARVVAYEMDEGFLTIRLSEQFADLSGFPKTLAAACLTLTLDALPEVYGVRLVLGASPWLSGERDFLTSSDFSLDVPILKQVDKELRLFFVDSETQTLVPEERQMSLRETEPAERYVLEALLGGSGIPEHKSALPPDAQLLGVYTEGGTCYVDMSPSFYSSTPPFSHLLAIEAIVRSLTALPDVKEVQFMLEGQTAPPYHGINLDKPLS